ncbi:MAG: carbon-nitrogen hydrolase family protein [Thermoanaerobaculia bacterium]|nr:carbon-nitrogen hydrolase family protein [Thermoanaerobaculia bacterium]
MSADRALRVALAQLSASEDREENLARALEAMREAKRRRADLIAFPELAIDRFFPRTRRDQAARELAEPIPGPVSEAIGSLARELSVVTVFNLYERGEDGGLYDASPVFDRTGRLLGVSRMVHITQYPGFWERDYYDPPAAGFRPPVFDTTVGRIGVAICYDRHFPELMRALGLAGAELVVIPQAGVTGEWPEGMFEAEVRTAAFQNGYFAALCNRVGIEGDLEFSGDSFVVDPEGRLLAQALRKEEDLLLVDLDLSLVEGSTARRLFLRDRRPGLYPPWLDEDGEEI